MRLVRARFSIPSLVSVLAVLALVPPAAQSEAPVMHHAAMEDVGEPPKTDVSKPLLPPRALLQIGTNDLRTRDSIMALAFSPDGRLIAAADANAPSPRVTLFDVRTGQRVKQIVAPGNQRGWVTSVAFSPDGTKLLWGEISGDVALWQLQVDRLLFREKLHGGFDVSAVAFSPDGSLMASAGGDSIQLRRVVKPAAVMHGFATRPGSAPANALVPRATAAEPTSAGPQDIGCLAFTPDGTRLVAGTSNDAVIFIWRIGDGELLSQIPGAHGKSASGRSMNPKLSCLTVTPDGHRVMSVGQTTKLLKETKLKYGAKNVTMSEVRFWDIDTGELIADYHGDEDYGFGYGALSRDGRHVAMADFSRLRILDASTGRSEQTIDLPGSWGRPPAFSPDGRLVAMPVDNAIGLFEVSTGRRLHYDESTPTGDLASVAWSPTGDRLLVGHSDGFVRVWHTGTGKLIWRKLLAPVINRSGWDARPAFVSFSRDGSLVVVAGRRDDPVKFDDGILAIYEAANGRTVREVVQKEVRWAALAPDTRMVVVATSQGTYNDTHFIGIEVATGRTRWAFPPVDQRAGLAMVAGIQFEGKSPWFGVALGDGSVMRFNGLTGHEDRRFLAEWRTPEQQKAGRPRAPGMMVAAFSGDGKTLVSSAQEWVYVWDVKSGTMCRKFHHRYQRGCYLTLAPDGRTLATSDAWYGADAIRLYDIETGEQILALEPGEAWANVMEFSPDGTRLFTVVDRSSGIIWDVSRGQVVRRPKE
jgi:WD40 repeat protein